jgi:hypothetical protein
MPNCMLITKCQVSGWIKLLFNVILCCEMLSDKTGCSVITTVITDLGTLIHCLNHQTLFRTERFALYTFCPAEKNQPPDIFTYTYSEEMAFSNMFMGSYRPENHEVKIQNSERVKSELRRSDRRVARCDDQA